MSGADATAAMLDDVADAITPTPSTVAAMEDAVDELTDAVVAAAADCGVDVEVIRVGSTARGTWLADARDIDLFIAFDPAVPRAELASVGQQIGLAVLPDGETEHAEHPYVHGTHAGFEVDLVPCYAVDDATALQSAVDRTPFHTAYLTERLTDADRRAVRLTKQFMRAVGVYGSDLRTQGFSGFLVELLVLHYGGFLPLIEAVTAWRPPVRLDPESHGRARFDDPLVVIDPTDPERNVAAVVSDAAIARLQHHARGFQADPTPAAFEPPTPQVPPQAELTAALERRQTAIAAVCFPRPDVVDDILYPQLRKAADGITAALADAGFAPVRTTHAVTDEVVLIIECAHAAVPAIERHLGPPVAVAEHAASFLERYAADPAVTGPFIEGDRYVVERPRAHTELGAFLRAPAMAERSLGRHIERVIADREVLIGAAVPAAERLAAPLATHLDPPV